MHGLKVLHMCISQKMSPLKLPVSVYIQYIYFSKTVRDELVLVCIVLHISVVLK